MAAVCQHFVQNAWKKDLCSNCFKSKEEHGAGPAAVSTVISSVAIPQGILRDSQHPPKRPKGTAVRFPTEESHVIGFGGDESFSSDEGEDNNCDTGGDSPPGSEDEDDRALQRLTRSNTDFNTSARPFNSLMLGQPRRETLLVTVKPFGDSTDDAKPEEKIVSKIPVIKTRTEKPKSVIRTAAFNGRADLPESVIKKPEISVDVKQNEDVKQVEKELSKPEEKVVVIAKEEHKMQIKFCGTYKKIEEPVCTLSVRKIEDGEYKASKVLVVDPPQEDVVKEMESRELAGEPDGRADSDEPPELPRSPPPVIDPRPSFLHGLVNRKDKPKIPVKPNKVLQARKPQPVTLISNTPIPQSEPLEPQSPVSDCSRTPKRQAPKPPPPPPSTPTEDSSVLTLFARNPSATNMSSKSNNSPVTREKEKRERASSCSPRISESPAPEPAPRRSLSLSVESLNPAPAAEQDKKKYRFSLRKFLRLGHHKDEEKGTISPAPQRIENIPVVAPLPRPRLEIIHPSDLNGAAVEVLRAKPSSEDSASTSSGSTDSKETEIMSCDSDSSTARPTKPPPPPRNQSLDAWGKTLEGLNKPARPPPPKSAELLRQQKQAPAVVPTTTTTTDNLYANLGEYLTVRVSSERPVVRGGCDLPAAVVLSGEVRSALAPNKPQRTASIRDANSDTPKRKTQGEDSGYESVELVNGKPTSNSQPAGENMYESLVCRSSSPECDTGIVKIPSSRYNTQQHRRSDGTIDNSPDFLKFRGSFVRSTSLPYCGSETESDIYSPYSFYGSEEGGDEDTDWSTTIGHPLKMSRLKLRKGRSIVHKSLEDNYGAVIVANHEALSQVLEQVNIGTAVPVSLRSLKTAVNLRWTDFTVPDEGRAVTVGRRIFHPAQWVSHQVTLCLTVDQGLQSGLPARGGTSTLTPITEFNDLVPARYLPATAKSSRDMVQASVAVLSKLHVDTIQSLGSSLRDKEEHWKDGSFVLLQLVNGLKLLQARGIEEAPVSLSSFVLCRDDRDPQPRLCVLHELNTGLPRTESNNTSLCQCALAALAELLPAPLPLAKLIGDLLAQERASSLSQVKSVLEFSLWGPADVALGVPSADRELALQRWLDLERATVLHGLVRTRIDLTPFEECHLLFLVRTNAKMMSEASSLLDSYKSKPEY